MAAEFDVVSRTRCLQPKHMRCRNTDIYSLSCSY